MNGKPVGVDSAFSMSPMQKRIATSIEKPMTPFKAIEATREWGTTVDAFLISSLMWIAPSAPMKAKTVVMRPTKKDIPLSYPPLLRYLTKTS